MAKVKNGRKAPRAQRAAGGDDGEVLVALPEGNVARTPRAMQAESIRAEAEAAETERSALDHRRRAALAAKRAAEADVELDEAERQYAAPAAKKYEFVLLSGEHNEDGVNYVYSRDHETVVPSNRRLDHCFMNKFRFLGGPTSPGRDYRPAFDRAGLEDPPLAETAPHGFQTQFSVDQDEKAKEKLAATRGGVTKAAMTLNGGAQGEDVTDKFPDAEAAKVKVYKDGRNYKVYDVDDLGSPLNEEEMTTVDAVRTYLKDLAEE